MYIEIIYIYSNIYNDFSFEMWIWIVSLLNNVTVTLNNLNIHLYRFLHKDLKAVLQSTKLPAFIIYLLYLQIYYFYSLHNLKLWLTIELLKHISSYLSTLLIHCIPSLSLRIHITWTSWDFNKVQIPDEVKSLMHWYRF